MDDARYRAWARDLADLVRRLPAEELARTIRAKMLDLIDRERRRADALSLRELRVLLDDLLGPDLAGYGAAILASYQRIIDVTNDRYADLGLDVGRDFARIRAIERANALDIGRYSDATKQRVARAVREALAADETAEQLIERIRPIDQRTEFYARTLGNTLVKRYSRGLKNEKARIAEVRLFQYVGVVRSTTRAFCRLHAGRTYDLDDILNLKNGNLEPVLDNCGGWNCVHDWEPDPLATRADTVAAPPVEDTE